MVGLEGNQNEADEIIYKNPHGADHCRRHHRYCRFQQNQFADRSASNNAFHCLDHFLRAPHRDHPFVLAAKQEEIANTYEHDRS